MNQDLAGRERAHGLGRAGRAACRTKAATCRKRIADRNARCLRLRVPAGLADRAGCGGFIALGGHEATRPSRASKSEGA